MRIKPHSSQGGSNRQRNLALAVGLIATFMTLLDVSIVNVAVPSIERALKASPSELQWVLSGYALTFGLVLVAAGRFGDIRGRRNVFIAGLALFTVSSAAAGLATSPEWLIIARLIQGAAAGVVNPQVVGMIQQMFQGSERGRPFGLLGSVIGLSTAIGPLLGGLLIALVGTHEGWRLVFFVNVPVGIAAIIFGWRVLPPHHPGPRKSLDPVAVLLLGLGVTLLLLPLIEERQWQGFLKWLLVPAAALVLAGFVYWERRYERRGEPLFDLALFRHRSYTLGSLIALLYFAGFTALFFIFTLFLQNGLRYSALAAGLAVTPFALGSAGTAILGGRLVNRYGRPLVAIGLTLVAIGLAGTMVALHFVPGRGAPYATAVPLLIAGLGSGFVITPNQTLTLAEVPVERGGAAAGMLQTGQRIGSAAGIAGVGTVFFNALAATHNGWSRAFRDALLIALGFVVIALIAALVDIVAGRRAAHRSDAAATGGAG
ncbi:MFS transporter [Micromonospora sp. NBC_01796]|uniref:MFS transporter n=1 Tax=Micromonospora sp. NBC_01796 TaxID=2975987 RepID=UPI002DDA50F5|nr:MFS transporter [Micromonospora sp. NBC_01796]WSA84935.1 MFS transporter [Micromonospora sp. NBC_01796]